MARHVIRCDFWQESRVQSARCPDEKEEELGRSCSPRHRSTTLETMFEMAGSKGHTPDRNRDPKMILLDNGFLS